MSKLYLVRHGKSEWNKLGQWTGWTDVDLNEDGYAEARRAGEAMKGRQVDVVYVSSLKRTVQTYDTLKEAAGLPDVPVIANKALDERSYGIYTGKNKWQVKEEVGDEEFQRIRRGYDTPIPEGESLKVVHDRVVPYFEETIKKDLAAGKNVLVSSHGNTLRALVKHLEGLSETEVGELEIGTGEIYCYDVDSGGNIQGKEILAANENRGKV